MTTRSAVSSDGASSQPAVSSRPAISSESLRFIWQPSVQTWNRGSVRASGRYSARRSSSGAGGRARRSGPTRRDRACRAWAGRAWRGGRQSRPRHGTPKRPRHGILRSMELLTNPETWIALATLTVLEIVLGIDNVIFISILVQRLPAEQRDRARLIGLSLAMGMRILLLLTISWIARLTQIVISLFGRRLLVARPDPDRRRPVPALEGDDRDPRVARGRARPSRAPDAKTARSAASSSRSSCSTSSSRSIRC